MQKGKIKMKLKQQQNTQLYRTKNRIHLEPPFSFSFSHHFILVQTLFHETNQTKKSQQQIQPFEMFEIKFNFPRFCAYATNEKYSVELMLSMFSCIPFNNVRKSLIIEICHNYFKILISLILSFNNINYLSTSATQSMMNARFQIR